MPTGTERRGPLRRAASYLAAGALGVGILVAPTLAAAAEPINGPLFYSGFPTYLATIDGTKTELDFHASGPVAFSPDGSKVAVSTTTCLDSQCSEDESTIRVHSVDGSYVDLAPVSGYISDVTWSPDQSQVGVQVGRTSDEMAIWRIPLDGNAPTKVISSSSAFRVDDGGIAWRPTGSSIAFVGTPLLEGGVSWAAESRQLYTVNAAGGTPSLFSAALPRECEECRLIEYAEPEWSPDGSQLAAYVVDSVDNYVTEVHTVREYLGRVSAGQLPTEVSRFQMLVDPSDYTYLQRQKPVWSADGNQLLYARDTDGETTAKIVTIDGELVSTPAEGDYDDWQPCPTGTCAAWGDATSGADVRVRVEGFSDKAQVGAAEPVILTVQNKGPEVADDVQLTVSTPGRSATQGWVRWRGAHDGWTCDTSNAEKLVCTGPSLADEQSVSLELGVVPVDVAKGSKLTATATTSSTDPRPTNNTVTQQQRISKLVRPKIPKDGSGRVSERILRKWGWFEVDTKKDLFLAATNIVYKEPVEVDGLPGWYSASLWAYSPHKSFYRVNFKNRVCGVRGGICLGFLGHPSDGADCYVPKSSYCNAITGSRVIFEGDKVQRASWKYYPGKVVKGVVIRTGKAKTYTYDLPRG